MIENHVMYAFQSESTLYSCLNVKELLAWNRRDIWDLSDSNGIRALNFRYGACFEQGVSWYSANYRA